MSVHHKFLELNQTNGEICSLLLTSKTLPNSHVLKTPQHFS
jgi:hypothetical protein